MARLTVTTKNDVVNPSDGVLSLREALAEADATPTVADTISFDLAAMGGNRIVLAGSQLTVDSDVTIDGGPGVTIDANQQSQVLWLLPGEYLDRNVVKIDSLTITGGHLTVPGGYGGGGGVLVTTYNQAVFSDCLITDNHVDVVGESGAFGGGIGGFGRSEILIQRSLISNNSADGQPGYGGGIWSSGPLKIVESTICNNMVIGRNYYASGGGVAAHIAELTQCTVTGNVCDGDRWAHGGGLALVDKISNSIIAGNSTAGLAGGDFNDVFGVGLSNGHNIFGSDVASNVAGDLENIPTSLLFAGGLADNGGPTPTIALRDAADNPALAGADPADSSATDQRGVARPQPDGTNPDIGAFELKQTTGGGDILGTARADRLTGTAQADVIRGLAGDDLLLGLDGNDRLFGDAQDDRLVGGLGLDQLSGGRGCDRFVYRSLAEAPVAGPGHDEVLDFSRLQHDRIDVSRIDAKAGVTGNQAFTFIGQAEFSAAGQLHYQATADGDFLVSGNVDRDMDADFAIVVRTGSTSLLAGDFLL
jgi:Ca2+-binding RTX toxin-like protein